MRRSPRIAVLLTLLAAVAMWIVEDEGTTVSPSPITPGLASQGFGDAICTADAPVDTPLPARESLPRTKLDPFSARSWAPPAPAAVVPAPPAAAPVAPPLPYRFVGKIVLPTETWVFLARGDDTFRVREGGTIGGEYKVESVKADELVLLHLASGVHQTARLASPGGENPGTGPQIAQAPADSAAVAQRDIFPYDPQAPADSAALAPSRGDARSIGPATVSASPIEEPPVQRVRRPHGIRRQVESTD